MIAFLTGKVSAKGAGYCLLEVGGVGYHLAMSTVSLAALPAVGDQVTIHTHLQVREDELSLFGFASEGEKTAFEQLITVSGVGPKVALATLSVLSPEALATAVASEDVETISSVPGIGKKTAQRIILDLKDKLGAGEFGLAGAARGPGGGAAISEATDALLGMGFSSAEVSAALKGADAAGDAQALLRYALLRLGGGR
jgi:Holliday junction DNA helicase RuvA